ncbi:hypothetical protein BFU36_07420 [Sulfolobus sp. A20]|uniref:IS200/IS605 family accessory protein TnpB-related protein n=1 Tax=Sulfolobaceae TaxID=118883 RepID=UPI000845F385|nr:zinc ribbon domain-containing protein [Sulfolobus sp. B1]AOL16554.1 hypothetical protein BFU36_07420 [Sulfolobus sp. A20]
MRKYYRIRDFHKKARKIGKWVVDTAKSLNVSAIFLEDLNNMIKRLPVEFRDKLYSIQYGRIQYWIEWQAKKYGVKVVYVDPSFSSTHCPKCGKEMKEVSYRYFHFIKCGNENDHDVIAILYGSLSISTVP